MRAAPQVDNARALDGYERGVDAYVATVAGKPSASADALARFAEAMSARARVLEVGSGPGWDADALEALGVEVHRTDAAVAFCEFQRRRGKRCARLDVLADALLVDPVVRPYAGAVMLCVLQHFAPAQLDLALAKLAGALATGGPMLLMYPEAAGACVHPAPEDGDGVRWPAAALDARLAQAGFAVAWDSTRQGRGGAWRTLLARKAAA